MLEEWRVETDFYTQLRAAQAADPHLAQIKQQLLAEQQPPPTCRMLYAIHNDLVVVPEMDGRQRIVVPPGPLRKEICILFHPLAGALPGQYAIWRASRFLLKQLARQGNNCLDMYGVIKRTPSRLAASGDSNKKYRAGAESLLACAQPEWVDMNPGGSNRCSQ